MRISAAYRDLKDIDEVTPLGADDGPCLEEIRRVLLKYNALDRFGITLLHSHFPIHEGETLLESCDYERRTLTMHTVRAEHISGEVVVGTAWRLAPVGDVIATASCGNACVASGGSHKRRHVKVPPVKP